MWSTHSKVGLPLDRFGGEFCCFHYTSNNIDDYNIWVVFVVEYDDFHFQQLQPLGFYSYTVIRLGPYKTIRGIKHVLTLDDREIIYISSRKFAPDIRSNFNLCESCLCSMKVTGLFVFV